MFKDAFGNIIELGDRVIHQSPYGMHEGFVESFTKQKVRVVHLNSFQYLPPDQYGRATQTLYIDQIPDFSKLIETMRQSVNPGTLVCLDKSCLSKSWKNLPDIKTRLGL